MCKRYDFPVAMIKLPDFNTAVSGPFNNLHGWWIPPIEVLEFWSTGCIVKYDPERYEQVKKEIKDSYLESVWDYWRMYAH